MKIEILSEKENPLLKRKEVKVKITFEGGIKSRKEIRKALISKLNSKDELTVLDGLKTRFGEKKAEGYVKVYKNREVLKVEPKYRLEKNFKEEKVGEEKEVKEEEGRGEETAKEEKEKKEEKESVKKEKAAKEKEEVKEGKSKEGKDK